MICSSVYRFFISNPLLQGQTLNQFTTRFGGDVDPETGRRYIFITNHFDWSAQTIADIYKQRWQVELFFKWIK